MSRGRPRARGVVARTFALAVTTGVSSACEVSVFGSEPIVLAGGVGAVTRGGETTACSEPEDLQRAREGLERGSVASGDADVCAFRCVFVDGALDPASEGTCAVVTAEDGGKHRLDMHRADGLIVRMEACRETVLHLGDTASARHDGSDDPTSAHDASVLVASGELHLWPAYGAGIGASHVSGFVPVSSAEGCPQRTLELTDGLVYVHDVERGVCGPSMPRIDPPTDAPARPDSTWYLALGRTLDGARSGDVPRWVELCFL